MMDVMTIKQYNESECESPKILIPMVKKTFPEIVSSEITHVSAWQYSESFLEHLAKVLESDKVTP